jgi:hypothetical protein
MMSVRIERMALALAVSAGLLGCSTEKQVSFANDVKPVLEQYCQQCHAAGGEGADKSGYRVDSYEGVLKGTKYGPVVVPGSAVSSTLWLLVAGKADPSIQMPHNQEPMPKSAVDTIALWIDQGAKNN